MQSDGKYHSRGYCRGQKSKYQDSKNESKSNQFENTNLLTEIANIEKRVQWSKWNIAIPVSTRGVGFSTHRTFSSIRSIPRNVSKLNDMTVHQMYRVQLAMVELKVFENQRTANLVSALRENWYNESDFDKYFSSITPMNVCTKSVGCLLKSLSTFSYENVTYVPLFPAPKSRNTGRAIPTPELVYLTNLRETVEYLSDPNTDPDIRQNFKSKNPIPSVTWGENNVITNPNDIIPQNYGRLELIHDIGVVKHWIGIARNMSSRLFTYVDMFSKGAVGNEALLVSNDSGDLACADNGVLSGTVDEYRVPREIDKRMFFCGAYMLAGELASVEDYLYPNYCLRTEQSAQFISPMSYQSVCQEAENF